MKWTRHLASGIRRWPIALAAIAVLAALILAPGIGSIGFWEPQERQLVDKAAPRAEVAAKRAADEAKAKVAALAARKTAVDNAKKAGKVPPPDPAADTCKKVAPEDAVARTLTAAAPALGRDWIDDSDAGRRLPNLLMGILTVLATAGIAWRLLGARAGLLAAIVVLAFPLLVLQARFATSEIGTACGAALIVFGLVSVGRGLVASLAGAVAFVGGVVIGFAGGGALLGVAVPLVAYAAATGFGVPAGRAITQGPRADRGRAIGELVSAALATVIGALAIAALVYTIYEIRRPYPGMVPAARSIAGHVIAPGGCWSPLLGGVWKPDDNVQMIYDSTFEQIAYGTFPWGILAPLAVLGLVRAKTAAHRKLGALGLAWAAGAWVAAEVFQRKVGFTIYAGFPAMAVAIGGWIDLVIARRADRERLGTLPRGDDGGEPRAAYAGPALLVALFFALGVLDLGKDLQSFTERLMSLLVGAVTDGNAGHLGDSIAYPIQSTLLWVPTRAWIAVLGVLVALPFAVGLGIWQPGVTLAAARRRRWAARALAGSLAATVAMGAFWGLAWVPDLAINMSSKTMFDTWRDEHQAADQLVVMGDLGDAPTDYAGGKFEKVESRDQVVASLARPNRVFAIAPQTELCTLHREIGGKPYFVLDDRNVKSILLTNKLADGDIDRNPLATAIVHAEPADIPQRPKKPVIWDKKIQLLGWDIPARVSRGSKFEVTLYYKILAPVGGAWTTLLHVDGASGRIGGDHKPIADRCPTSTWQNGDYIIDRATVSATSGSPLSLGPYEVWTGFFTGTSPNFKNMPVTDADPTMRDGVDRVKITTITLE